MSDNFPFSPEYQKNKDDTAKVEIKSVPDKITIETDKYGTSKPRRVILRASIIHDKS